MSPFLPTPPDPSKPGSFPPNPAIPIAPPPWTLKAQAWTFLYSDINTDDCPSQNPNNTPETLQSILPPGAYHPFETLHASALRKLTNGNPQFQTSWLKAVMIVRYTDTDVGPYDELILIPGRAVNPNTGKKEMRISTIYVSTDASVWSGRRNWNIPKHRARFEFTPVGTDKDIALKVYHPENAPAPLDPNVPFFTVLLKGSSLPKLPLPALAPLPLVQPPLLKSRWPPGIQDAGSWGLSYPARLDEGENTLQWHGDRIGFPKVNFWAAGTVFDGVVGFGVADVVS
ncbi:hypothetical protein BDW62DRAFT_197311 [Aspergillus aurantiobrunneus]